MIVKIFTNSPNINFSNLYTKDENEFLIGVDKGAYLCSKCDIKLDLSIGDFDSCENNNILEEIMLNSKKTLILDKIKDDSDTLAALKYALNLDFTKIIIYSNSLGRVDHYLANIKLLQCNSNIVIIDELNELSILEPGIHTVDNNRSYISFFAISNVPDLTLKAFKYSLDNYNLSVDDTICLSNEGSGEVTFTDGLILMIKSNDYEY